MAQSHEVHVYAPGQEPSEIPAGAGAGIIFHGASAPRPSSWRHFGLYPAALRKDWSRLNTKEVWQLISELRPDRVHVEYIQPVESVLGSTGVPWTVTLHDVTTRVFRQRADRSRGLERPYRWLEFLRVSALEKKVVKKAKRVFTLSARDAAWVARFVPRNAVSHLKVGIDRAPKLWSARDCESTTFVFAGAMWRDANIAAASYLVHEVMPIVWESLPSAVLRIVGSRPSAAVVALGDDHRVQIVGEVPSIEDEYIKAAAVLSPSLVDAGVLLKALRALACGSPLIVNDAAAVPLEVTDGVECFVRNSPREIASQMISISEDSRTAEKVAAAGPGFIHNNFSWKRFEEDMATGIDE
ncbi:glycosyltransferase involved in cell wall biosynthesis [Arthrobacter globiformis]|nr:glycosyltransferase involved in cell wall biosynthesis [Arthrobacter globiformis]